jgi:hypothetical protein
VFGTFFTPVAILDEFKFVGGIGLIFFGQIILGTANGATKGDKDPGCFFRFGHGGII